MRLAIFDFDGTLYKHETFKLLLNYLKQHPIYKRNYRTFFYTLLPHYIGAKLHIYPEKKMRHHSMQAYMAALDRLSKDHVNEYFAEIAQEMRPHFNQSIVEKISEHNDNNVHTMLVSGAFTPLLEQFQGEFQFDTIIGTDIPFLKNEVNKTEIVDHVQNTRKVEKIYEIVQHNQIDWENSFAYADSFSDLPVLKLVGHPVAVDPDVKLTKYATEHDWEILL